MNKLIRNLKYFLLRAYKTIYQASYRVLSAFTPLDENKVVLVVSRSQAIEGNLKYIRDELTIQRPTAKIHLISSVNKMNLKLFKELFILAGARYLIIDDYFLPLYLIKPAKSMKVVQLWHAAGAFKMFGHSTVDKKFGPEKDYLKIIPIHSNYTHVYVSSPNIIKHYAEAFNMPEENIFPLGVPRTDLFENKTEIRKTVKKITASYPGLSADKTIILFAPTYRAGNKQKESDVDFVDTLTRLSKDLDADKLIVYKPHPYLLREKADSLKNLNNIIVAKDFSINEWMLTADAFITDYSSAIIEYAILKKPLAHFVPDLEEYRTGRGLYYPIEEISDGEIIREYSELSFWINSRQKNESWDTRKMISFNFSGTSQVAERITRHFLS